MEPNLFYLPLTSSNQNITQPNIYLPLLNLSNLTSTQRISAHCISFSESSWTKLKFDLWKFPICHVTYMDLRGTFVRNNLQETVFSSDLSRFSNLVRWFSSRNLESFVKKNIILKKSDNLLVEIEIPSPANEPLHCIDEEAGTASTVHRIQTRGSIRGNVIGYNAGKHINMRAMRSK